MMVTVILEHRFVRTPDGVIWTQTAFPRSVWERYLDVFDEVRVCARVKEAKRAPGARADGPGIGFFPVPHYIGPLGFARRFSAVRRDVRKALIEASAVILRVPSWLATIGRTVLRNERRPYALEVVGDPWDVFSPKAVRHPLRPFFRRLFAWQLRAACRQACAVAYVTREALQRRYPPSPGAFATHYSSVELRDEAFVPMPRPPRVTGPYVVASVGSLEQLYKGPDVMIKAASICVRNGIDLHLVLVGGGKHREELEELSEELRIRNRVEFAGQLPPGAPVRDRLDRADLFVLPSRQEGLPRTLLEAMARGLPCIGSAVGGIPELLPPEDLVPPGNPAVLADLIAAVLQDPERRARMAARNLENARAYREEVLQKRRIEFYREVKRRTERWYGGGC
ncbi:MAG: glycosyltransferase family 4 protein [Planctomycetota bacterium]